jgi:hypothetical protein
MRVPVSRSLSPLPLKDLCLEGPAPSGMNFAQVQQGSFTLEKTTDFELDLISVIAIAKKY